MKTFKVEYINKNGALIKYTKKAASYEEVEKPLKGYVIHDLKIIEVLKND